MKQLKLWTVSLLSVLTFSCTSSDDGPVPADLPKVTTKEISGIANTTAASGGVVNSQGGSAVTTRGVCWSNQPNPTIQNSKTNDGTGTGNYSSTITGLDANTKYYLRAYATNNDGTAYGNELSFTTTNLPAQGSIREFIADIVTDREGNTSVTNGVTTCLFVDGVFFDMDPYAVSYTVLFYDMVRTLEGTPTTYPDDFQYDFAADFGKEIFNGPYGNSILTNWYNVNNGIPVTKFTNENKLFVSASWCTTGGCKPGDCYLVTGKAKVTVRY